MGGGNSHDESTAAYRKRPAGFKVTGGKGFHVTFENGWTVSVQFGGGNYSANYNEPIGGKLLDPSYELPPSATAEIAAWGPDGVWHDFGDDTVAGWKTPADVLAFMQEVAKMGTPEQSAAYLDEHGKLTYAGFRAVKDAMTVAEWRRVEDKCWWEHMTPWAVLNEWPSLRGSGAAVLS